MFAIVSKLIKALIFRCFSTRNYKKIIQKAETYETVSFDMFDTLIRRNVKRPADVFMLVSNRYQKIHGVKVDEFPERRILAEAKAMRESSSGTTTLEQIYSQLDCFSSDEKQLLMNLEIEAEKELCVTNRMMAEVYNELLAKRKNIIIISDMYLPGEILESILSHCGIYGYKKLYVSGETRKSKRRGTIFDHVCSDLNLQKKHLIHIGDSVTSDFLQPLKKGIMSILLATPRRINDYYSNKYFSGNDLCAYETISSVIDNTDFNNKDITWKIGFETYGPLLYGFTQWLNENVKTNHYDRVFFFARDGYIIQKSYELFAHFERQFDKNCVRYVYFSSRSLIVPAVWTCSSIEEVYKIIGSRPTMTVRRFLTQIGLDPESVTFEVEKAGLKMSDFLDGMDFKTGTKLDVLYSMVKKKADDNSREEYGLLCEYLEQEGFRGNIAVVDVGWRGHLQKALESLPYIKKNCSKVDGYYLGIYLKNSIEREQYSMQGYFYTNDENLMIKRSVSVTIQIIELFFTATHGSTKKFARDGDVFVPVLFESEFKSEDSINKLCFLQDGAMYFVQYMLERCFLSSIDISAPVAYRNIRGLTLQPRRSHIRVLGQMAIHDVDKERYLADPRSLDFYLLHPRQFISDLKDASWKVGFLKKLFILPLPYWKIIYRFQSRLSHD